MPHFVIDCSENILKYQNPKDILEVIHKAACDTGLFTEADVKIRLNPFDKHYLIGGKEGDFIHVFAHIMEGRNTDQKAILSKVIVQELKTMFPNVPFIAMNVNDFEKATYCNKTMI